ncbi:MAG TPA: response regulator [Thermoanaerobaculia bacterium]|nr:response regulator [Thermoanaerobaculia bacterium]
MSLLSHNEADRLEALRSALGLTRQPEPRFDDLARLAAEICGVPFAVVGLVDEKSEWFKSRVGIPLAEVPRDGGFCAETIRVEGSLVVDDAAADARFTANPLVASAPSIRFWAGVPLVWNQQPIGALGVMDRHPKSLSAAQMKALAVVAAQLVGQIGLGDQTARRRTASDELEQVRDLLEESEDRFRDLFEHADDWVMSIGADGRILHTNRACVNALGYEEVARRSVRDLIEPESRSPFAEVFERVMLSGVAERVETVFVSGDGHRIHVEGGLNPKVIAEKSVLARVIFRDISDRKRYEEELSRARDAALESARLKSQFLTNVSHEIRTPMNGIIGMIDLLLDTSLTPEQKDFAQTALSSAESLLATINNILQISKLETGKAAVSVADFDPQRTVERIFAVMEIAAMEKPVRMLLELDPSLPTVLRGDVGKFRQALTNIVSNAIKFTAEGSVRIRVLRDRDTSTHVLVRVEVHDTGPGIPDAIRPRVFEAFTQADGSTTREHGGVGLGLATARRLIELMGGVLGLESEPGKGTTVWFNLPFEKQPEKRASTAPLRRDLEAARALVLDASETSARVIHHYMRDEWKMRSDSASSPVEALTLARKAVEGGDPFDLLVFDLRMAGLDGFEFAQAVQSDPSIAASALLLLVPLGEKIDEGAARRAGIAASVAKPVERSELFDAVTSALLHRGSKRSLEPSAAELAAPSPPAPPPAAAPVGFELDAPAPGAALPSAVPVELGSGMRILLAEDNALNQKVALMQLRKLGFEVDAVSNGMEVIEALRERDYQVILMDCQMPRMDGYEATKEIRRREGDRRKIRIIAMTAHALEGDREKCLAAGMDDYLSKPLKQDELIAAISRTRPAVS